MASPPSAPNPDLLLVFRVSSKSLSKQEAIENAKAAESEYARILTTLRDGGLKATGRRGERNGQLLIVICAPERTLSRLVLRERHSDFLRGLPTSELPSLSNDITPSQISPADRIRMIYEYITSSPADDGLGIMPGSKHWSRVESLMALHDRRFNSEWLQSWTRRQIGFAIGFAELDKLKHQFGEAVALYFSFLSCYTHSLLLFAPLGLLFGLLKMSYNSIYSSLLMIWSITFVEFWRLREKKLAVRWGTRGATRVERRRYAEDGEDMGGTKFPWWKRDMRVAASVPLITLFGLLLAALLTGIFIIEAFVTQLYQGPGSQVVSFSPTILFIALVPRLLAVYQTYAVSFTEWERHTKQSEHEGSLALKTFALSSIVAYSGLALSAFVYVPFGATIMGMVQQTLSSRTDGFFATAGKGTLWEQNPGVQKLNPARLQNQMFAFTVTNQAINAFLEVGLPFIMRGIEGLRSGKGFSNGNGNGGGKKKRVVFEDENSGAAKEEREFLEKVRHEVSLPEYTLFGDYSEMVTQFGYVALWSTIWPLASVMALLNNWLELRSDAFKIVEHNRRPIPVRSDSIGPWLDSLGFITWLAALTNSALVYLFRPAPDLSHLSTILETSHPHTAVNVTSMSGTAAATYINLTVPALIIALASSHGYILVRLLVRHILVRVVWRGSPDELKEENADRQVKAQYLKSLGLDKAELHGDENVSVDGLDAEFWNRDEGLYEIQKVVKEA
ncbi:DUF590-domain-containing protein [Rickenella mellea]|uniref:DUF590-domain-containing protein n=1 Tax=Rickenella mellea TaxID=50990 RepID=A0A4Y7Q851_9AGAM|nr:DUF590-domain-containing protein [Rickenella mellea]